MTAQDGFRLPLEGSVDLTYRCNNHCRHCWVSIPAASPEIEKELTCDQISAIVDQAREMGCRKWAISGGEPMLRADFPEIFDYMTHKAVSYSLNTNGTLITPRIARLMKRKGNKMVAIYGANEAVHDRITRKPGSFQATLQGIAYLKEAGAGFAVQLIPMKDNHFQFKEMLRLAESLSPIHRIGASWLYLSAAGDPERNKEIAGQRLEPKALVELDRPDPSSEDIFDREERADCAHMSDNGRLFASCIAVRRDFHVDPYGGMSFCCFLRDPALRYDLKNGSFRQGWDMFIPSLGDKILGGKEHEETCGRCRLREDCYWCPVVGYLEHGRFSAKVDYLCAVAQESREFRKKWEKEHRRHYQIAGLTISVESDLPISDATFGPRFKRFETHSLGEDVVTIRHAFSLPDLKKQSLGEAVYRKPPWAIYRKGNSWIYVGISPDPGDEDVDLIAVFSQDHSNARIYHGERGKDLFMEGNLHSLTLFPSDQILFSRALAERGGCCFHAAGAILENRGFLFLGHSEAGKSTLAGMLMGKAKILCDDRIILREGREGFRVYGTWSHGDVSEVSPDSAPLAAVLYLEQAEDNALIPMEDRWEGIKNLPAYLIKPLETRDWWEKMLLIIEKVARDVPCYTLQFNKSGGVVDLLRRL